MNFENVTEFINTMYQNNKTLERKKESLLKLVKQIQKDEAKLHSQKIKAQKILEEILALEKKTNEENAQ
ncbi:hypothetical protein [uncultured Helicobacter sp.]|uniref:hypothetical protein n=1 Tax=uncultured Helicobacter sp. TaxID=175537 RepID=UPI0026113DE1|nr:hypothetical protein [uncultured Helicobacter sp.]